MALSHHELAAKLHSANGRISRAMRMVPGLDQSANLSDARTIVLEVIAELLCEESTQERFAHKTMPVIPRDRPFPI